MPEAPRCRQIACAWLTMAAIFHVFPRLKDDGIFAIPEGNAESGFYRLDRSTAQKEASRLR